MSSCFRVFRFNSSIYLYHTPNDSTARVIPSFSLVGKPKSRSVNAPHRPVTTWLNHGSVCVFLPRKDAIIFMDIELISGPYQLESSSFQLNRDLPVSSSPSISQKSLGLFSSPTNYLVVMSTQDMIELTETCNEREPVN